MPVERTQEAQIEALRALIIYQVDAIVFTPLVESGAGQCTAGGKSASVPLMRGRSVRPVENCRSIRIGGYAGLADGRRLCYRHQGVRYGAEISR